MKKVLLLSFLILPFICAINLHAQKDKKKSNQVAYLTPSLATEADSTAYIFGMAMKDGLNEHLLRIGVLKDTTEIVAEFDGKIETATNKKQKKGFAKRKGQVLDSINSLNSLSFDAFIKGYQDGFFENRQDESVGSLERESYLQGAEIAERVSIGLDEFNRDVLVGKDSMNKQILVAAFVTVAYDQKPLIEIDNPQAEIQSRIERINNKRKAVEQEKHKAKHQVRIAKEEAFLAENAKRTDVVTLPSGLQYEILRKGTGVKPNLYDEVTVHYRGALIDGTQFDSSYDRGEPTKLTPAQVIKGWTEALQLMPAGSKWKLYIPSNLAYEGRDMGDIKPFSALIFEVELISVTENAISIKDVLGDPVLLD